MKFWSRSADQLSPANSIYPSFWTEYVDFQSVCKQIMSVIALLGSHIFQTLTARQTAHNTTGFLGCAVLKHSLEKLLGQSCFFLLMISRSPACSKYSSLIIYHIHWMTIDHIDLPCTHSDRAITRKSPIPESPTKWPSNCAPCVQLTCS